MTKLPVSGLAALLLMTVALDQGAEAGSSGTDTSAVKVAVAVPETTAAVVSPAPGAGPEYLRKLPQCLNGSLTRDQIQQAVRAEAERQGADAKLALAIAGQESDFGQNNNSDAGARGPMQLMPGTASDFGVTDICDTAQNIRAGVRFMHELMGEFGGNVMLVVAAYNSGKRRVESARGIPAIAETVNYVALVTNAYYGFDNTMKGGKRARGAAKASTDAATPDATGSTKATDPILPINNSKPKQGGQWIGGSVLYVGEGDGL